MQLELLTDDKKISVEEINFIERNSSTDYNAYSPFINRDGIKKIVGTIMAATIYTTTPNIIEAKQIIPFESSIADLAELDNNFSITSDYVQLQNNLSAINEHFEEKHEDLIIEENLITTYNAVVGDFIRSRKKKVIL